MVRSTRMAGRSSSSSFFSLGSSSNTRQFVLALGVLFVALLQIEKASSHGMMLEPPSRNTLWRTDRQFPANYNDNELFCGGRDVQWNQNNGKCGVCGDPWDAPKPRPHEDGGLYGTGHIARTYTKGQDINVEIRLSANHMGHFRFRICKVKDNTVMTFKCFDRYLPVVGKDTLLDRFPINYVNEGRTYSLTVRLPADLTCKRCVVQWVYKTGNHNGFCANGTDHLGCGQQEYFVNCADVAIIPGKVLIPEQNGTGTGNDNNSGLNTVEPLLPAENRWKTQFRNKPLMGFVRDFSRQGHPFVPYVVRTQSCVAIGRYRKDPHMDMWCVQHCMSYEQATTCPTDKCQCFTNENDPKYENHNHSQSDSYMHTHGPNHGHNPNQIRNHHYQLKSEWFPDVV